MRAIIHYGELYIEEHDIQGTEADFAGRLRDQNRGAELWLSAPAKVAVDNNGAHQHLKWTSLQHVELRDFEDGHGQPIWALRALPQSGTAEGVNEWPLPLPVSPGRSPPRAISRIARRPQNFEEVDFLARGDVAYDRRPDSQQNMILAQVDFVPHFFIRAPHARIEFEIQRAFLIVWNEGPGAISQSDALEEAANHAYFIPLRDVPPGAVSVCIDPVQGAVGLARSALPPTHGENELSEVAKASQDVDFAHLRAELRVPLDPEGLRLEFDPAMAASVSELERKHIKAILRIAMERGDNIKRGQIRKKITIRERAREE